MNDHVVDVEPLTIIIRGFDHGKSYGDPYSWSCVGVRVARGILEIQGAMNAPPLHIRRALFHKLRSLGWKKVLFYHYRNGKPAKQEINLLDDKTHSPPPHS